MDDVVLVGRGHRFGILDHRLHVRALARAEDLIRLSRSSNTGLSRGVFVAALVMASADVLPAQRLVAPSYAEYRGDVIVGRGTSLEAGGGAVVPLGIYVRFNIDGAAGATWRDGAARLSGRIDAIGRFLLDPYHEEPVGFSLGGGVSVPAVKGDAKVRPYLTAVIDVEGRARGPVTPAIQIGLGGGARVGIVLRTSPSRWR